MHKTACLLVLLLMLWGCTQVSPRAGQLQTVGGDKAAVTPVTTQPAPDDRAKEAAPEVMPLQDCLVLAPVSRGVRSFVFTDPIEYALVTETLEVPKAGQEVTAADGKIETWVAAQAKDGSIEHEALAGGYLWWTVHCDTPRTALLVAQGHMGVYVNGEPRIGDWYGTGYVRLPVALQKGDNQFMFRCARGYLNASLELQTLALRVLDQDPTLPDVAPGVSAQYFGAVLVANLTDQRQRVAMEGQLNECHIPAFGLRKVPFRFTANPAAGAKEWSLKVKVTAGGASTEGTFSLRVRTATQVRKITFVSQIDGSVQYYALNPANPLAPGNPPGIVLSLHGASVEALGQAEAYFCKNWCHIVCPTNRRPFGFDWEDWGRKDALEVLAHAKATLDHDPSMIYLAGHSMGGHGTWQLGAHFPGLFAAIAPSAGWCSFWSYAGKREGPQDDIGRLIRRAENPSDTLLLKHNYAQEAVYILHGDADDNVPVTEARAMRDALKEFHTDLQYFEQPGAGHWWDQGNETDDRGADCLDWRPFFDLFARRRLPAASEVRELDFTTISPAVSASCHWLTIAQQQRPCEVTRLQVRVDPGMRRVRGTSQNAQLVCLQLRGIIKPGPGLSIELDGSTIEVDMPKSGELWLRHDSQWQAASAPQAAAKQPRRYGGFKEAFDNQYIMVYGTGGDAETRRWAQCKARFDAEHFWYRGNGSVEILPDTDFDPARYPDRNVILIGSPATNSGFAALKLQCPLDVQPGKVQVGDKSLQGDLALLAVVPRPDSNVASVGIIAGTSLRGMRTTNRLPYLVSGVGLPDFVVLDAEMLRQGDKGLRAAGFFDSQWEFSPADSVIR